MAKTQGPTYNPSKIKRIRSLGYMAKKLKWTGRNVLKRRRLKGRASLTVSDEFGSKVEKNKKFRRRR